MKRKLSRALIVASVAILSLATLSGCAARNRINPNTVVTTIGDHEVSLGLANFFVRFQQGQYETFFAPMMGMTPDTMWEQAISSDETYESSVKSTLMTNLETMIILSQHAEEMGVSVTDEERTRMEAAADAFIAANTTENLELISGDKSTVVEYLELLLIQSRMNRVMREGIDENVSDEEAGQRAMEYIFLPFTSTNEDGEAVTMSEPEQQVLEEKARVALEKLNGDENYSINDAAAELEVSVQNLTFDATSTSPDPAFIEAMAGLTEEGQTNLTVGTNGIYIGQLTSLLDREATDARADQIRETRRNDQYEAKLAEWREATTINLNQRAWNRIDFTTLGITIYVPSTEGTEDQSETDATTEGAAEGDEGATTTDESGATEESTSADESTENATDDAGDEDTAE